MANVERENFRYYGVKVDGSKDLLLDTLDFYSNHSAIPMHNYVGEKEEVDFVLDRKVKKLLVQVEKNDNTIIGAGYRIAIVLIVAYCLRKYKPFKILYVGNKPPRWMENLSDLLHQFHPESRLYWLTNKNEMAQCNCCISIKMPFEELLLPQRTFDVVILDDTDESLIPTMKETIWLSLRLGGQEIILSKRHEIMDDLAGDKSVKYKLGDDWKIGHRWLYSKEYKAIESDTMDGAVNVIINETIQRIMLVQNALLSMETDLDVLLLIVDEVEHYILLIYAFLPSMEIKYLANEWKRALLDYRLGGGKKEKVREIGEILLLEIQ